jgi:hypothetical protein
MVAVIPVSLSLTLSSAFLLRIAVAAASKVGATCCGPLAGHQNRDIGERVRIVKPADISKGNVKATSPVMVIVVVVLRTAESPHAPMMAMSQTRAWRYS